MKSMPLNAYIRKNCLKPITYASYLKILEREEQNELKASRRKEINLREEINEFLKNKTVT